MSLLRRPVFLLAAVASAALMGCPSDNGTDSGTDASTPTDTGAHDTGTMDVTHQDVPVTDTVTPTDSGNACGTGVGSCSPVTNQGCDTGQSCVFGGDGDGGVTTLCTTPGTVAPGGACNTADACLQGFACLGNPGVCTKLCCGPSDTTTCRTGVGGTHATCSIPITSDSGDLPFYACQATVNCDWFIQDCPSNGNCRPTDSSGTTTCETAGTGTNGTICSGTGGTPCARGFACISTQQADGGASPGTCRQVCDPGATGPSDAGGFPRTCPTNFSCGGVNGLPTNYGVCIPN